MHESISSTPDYSYLGRQNVFLALVRQPVKEEENSEFKQVVIYFKIDLELCPVCWGRAG